MSAQILNPRDSGLGSAAGVLDSGAPPSQGPPPRALGRHPGQVLLALSVGIGGFFLLPQGPPPWFWGAWGLAAVLLAGLVLARVRGSASPRAPSRARLLGAAVALGTLWAAVRTGDLLWFPFPDSLAREPLTVEGRIASIPTDLGYARRFLLRVDRAWTGDGAPVPFTGLVRLSWYDGPAALRAGALWRLPVRLRPRHGFANPGGFDYERWLFEQGIKATGGLRKGAAPVCVDPGPGAYWLTRWRQAFNEHMAAVLGNARALPLVQALVTGDQSGFDRADWEAMARTGTSHLVAISGLNLALVAGVAYGLVRRLWGRWPRLALTLAAPRAAAVGGLVAASAYAALAGFSVSTQRALVMAAVVFALIFWERAPRYWHGLTLALTAVLLLDPTAAISYGFWLSFAAVAVLLFHMGQRLPRRDLWTRLGRAQWAVAVGLMPLLFLLFGRASTVAPVVNLVAEPLFTLLLFPLVLGASLLSLVPGLSAPLVWTAQLLDRCLDGLAWVSAFPWAAATLPLGPAWVWLAAGAGVALILAPRGLPGRGLGLVLLAPLILVRPPAPGYGEAWVTVLDVGQGLSVVVRTAGGTLVYDAGPGFDSGFNTGGLVVAPFLLSQGVASIDTLILSHGDRDHAGGASGLLERVSARRILSGEPAALDLAGAEPCVADLSWEWSGVRFRILAPEGAAEAPEGNDASCVLRVETGGRSVLLPGDIGRKAEGGLVRRKGAALASDILVAGHHGSATSSSAPFLDAVHPELVLYATGYANRFRFPAKEVQQRVSSRGIAALDTASAGAVELRLCADGRIDGPWLWRERSGRLWTHRPEVTTSVERGASP